METQTMAPRTLRSVITDALEKPMASYYLVLVPALLLMGLGMLMVLSSSSVYAFTETGDSYYYVKRQLFFLGFGFVAMFGLSLMPPTFFRRISWPVYFLAVGLLLLTFVPGIGIEINGNRNWVELWSSYLRFQPSEFAKLAMVIWGAQLFVRKDTWLDTPRQFLMPFLPFAGFLVFLVVAERDLGTAMIMGAILLSMLWIVGAPIKTMSTMVLSVAIAIVGLVAISPNRMQRILGFIQPHTDLTGVNQQPLRGIFALASGGWWGLGLGASRQKWGLLVEAHTDYVLAIIGEEMGLVGTLMVLFLFLTLGYAGFRIALRSESKFCRYAAAGISSWFMIQTLTNVLVVFRLAPVIGIPLPLVSYGGSALLASMCALGVLLSCARHEPQARTLLERKKRQSKTQVTSVVDQRKA